MTDEELKAQNRARIDRWLEVLDQHHARPIVLFAGGADRSRGKALVIYPDGVTETEMQIFVLSTLKMLNTYTIQRN